MRLIDADALVESIKKYEDIIGTPLYMVRKHIDSQPTIEPKHGRWVENKGRYGWYCSQCKKENNYAYHYNESNAIELQDYYCPNCGAKMDEVEDG